MNQDSICRNLVRLTEAPDARLRRLPREQLNPAEQHVLALLELIGLLQELYLEDDDLPVAERVAGLSQDQCARFDAALLALELPRERRRLRTVWRALLQGLEGAPLETRVLTVAERCERHIRALSRLAFGDGAGGERLQAQLVAYLDAHQAQVPDWPRPGAKQAAQSHATAPASTRTFLREGSGDKYLFVFRQNDAEALLDDWLREHPAAFYTGGSRRPATTLREARGNSRWFHGMPEGAVLGQLKPGRTARMPSRRDLYGPPVDAVLAALAEDFAWAVFSWPNTMQESPLAWLGSDAVLADAWDRNLRRHARTLALISRYRQLDSLPQLAGGVQFGESHGYGEAALVAAEGEPWLPWLVVNISSCTTQVWRRWTHRLQSCAVLPNNCGNALRVAYRTTDRDAYLALWNDLDYDRGIVEATVCGRDDPLRILQSFNAARHGSAFHTANFLSERHGWAYSHVHGGGLGEHHAMFHAQDTAITRRVTAFAAAQSRWYLSGWW
ncbi:hypothetical protein [Tahibacter harae]|uniref:Uncharacterized protein n=1 Tax=Tahibacter harae TaxID=2963937 RepID=A0ABT1QYE9_9GAMM|nr:hypothetical protein [Tahibacter harae]MCQ4167320.1 hypothetical protein [Tahibacter harae]